MSSSVWYISFSNKKIEFKKYPKKKKLKKIVKKKKKNYKKVLVNLLLTFSLVILLGVISSAEINDTLHINLQTTYSNGTIQSGTFTFTFNITENSSSSCLGPVVYNHSVNETTDTRGIVSIYLPTNGSGGGNLSELDFDKQYYLCYYRDGTLKDVSQLGRVPYSFRATQVNLSEITVDSNLSMTDFNVTASWFKGIYDWIINASSQSYLNFNGTHLDFNETQLNTTIDSKISSGSVNNSDFLDGYNSLFFMPLNTSVYGDFDFNGGWTGGGFSISGGDIYAQALYVYNITSLTISNLNINGSLFPQEGYDDTFDIGSSTLRWRDLYLGGEVLSDGTGNNYFLGNIGIGTASPNSSLHLSGTTPIITIGNGTYSNQIATSEAEGLDGVDLRIGLNESTRNLIISDLGDIATDFGLIANSYPSLIIMDNDGNSKTTINTQQTQTYITGANYLNLQGPSFVDLEGRMVRAYLNNDQVSGNFFQIQTIHPNYGLTDTDEEQAWVWIAPTIQQSGTANYVGLLMNVTEDSIGDGSASGFPNSLMDLRVNDISKFMINSTGYVGINTTTPQNILNVVGEGNFTGNLYGGTVYSGGSAVLTSYSETDPHWTGNYSNVAFTNIDELFDENLSVVKNLSVDGNTLFVDSNNNKVGINTTSPSYALDVNGSINIPNDQTIKLSGDDFVKYSSTYRSVSIGKNTGVGLGYDGVFVGDYAGYQTTGRTTAIGYYAGYNNSGNYITAVGNDAGKQNLGDDIAVLGYSAGSYNSGNYLVAVGYGAGSYNEGSDVISLGRYSVLESSGNNVIGIGYQTGEFNSGDNIIILGYQAGYLNSGNYTIGIGYQAGFNNSGNNTIGIGYQAGFNNTLPDQFIVKQANVNAIPLIQGNFSSGNVGIGTTSPYEKFHVVAGGTSGLSTAAGGDGVIITDDAAPALYFEDLSEGSNDKVMTMTYYNEDLTIGSMSDTGGAWDQQYVAVFNRDGNVGINTTTPQNTLNVAGTFNATGNWYSAGTTIVTGNQIEADSLTQNDVDSSEIAADAVSDSELDGGFGWTLDTDLNIDSNTLVVSYDDNKVGIGTASPASKLSVGGNGNVAYAIYGTGTDYGVYGVGTDYGVYGQGTIGIYAFGDTHDFYAGSGANNYFAGNVGVGDSSPDYKLDVAGTLGVDSTLTMTGTAANIALGSNYLSGDGGDEGVYVSSSGYVGIGTVSPDSRLSVGGNGNSYWAIYGTGGYVGVYGAGTYTGVQGDGGTRDFLANNGKFEFAVAPSSANTETLCWDGDGASLITDCSSSIELKRDVNDMNFDWDSYMQLRPITFFLKDPNATQDIQGGFVAEYVDEVMKDIHPELVDYKIEDTGLKKPYGVDYNAISALNVKAIQELKQEISQLKEENNKLKELVCLDHSEAEFCNKF